MISMLTLNAVIKEDPESQALARFVKDGFRLESWRALAEAGDVYEARITALPHPDKPGVFSTILLCTTYGGDPPPYHRFFFDKLTLFFILVGFAAKDPPFGPKNFSPEELAAVTDAQELLLLTDALGASAATAGNAGATTPELSHKHELIRQNFLDAFEKVTTLVKAGDQRKASKGLKTNFERFSAWVDAHDLTFVPPTAAAAADKKEKYKTPPSGIERNQFFSPKLPILNKETAWQ
jgi:hypothetical protein